MLFVAVDVGCIECGEPTTVLGVFTEENDAFEICNKYRTIQKENWSGQHSFEVHQVPDLNTVVEPVSDVSAED